MRWLELMAIPLERGVPVVYPDGRGTVVGSPRIVVQPRDLSEPPEEMEVSSLRVDLDEPTGRAYAVSWAILRMGQAGIQVPGDLPGAQDPERIARAVKALVACEPEVSIIIDSRAD